MCRIRGQGRIHCQSYFFGGSSHYLRKGLNRIQVKMIYTVCSKRTSRVIQDYNCPSKFHYLFRIPLNLLLIKNIVIIPVKNVTWILMEIPCRFPSKIDGSLVQIHTKFHDYSMSFIQFYLYSMLEHDTDFGQVQVMGFPGHLLRK